MSDRPTDLEAAREMFFAHDGSRFYMSRNDLEQRYLDYRVPRPVEAEWLAELTEEKLAALHERGNWRSVNFVLSHSDTRHLDLIAGSQPQGVFWEKCAFLELLLKYVRACRDRYPTQQLLDVCNDVSEHAGRLGRRVRADRSVRRVAWIIEKAEAIREELRSESQ